MIRALPAIAVIVTALASAGCAGGGSSAIDQKQLNDAVFTLASAGAASAQASQKHDCEERLATLQTHIQLLANERAAAEREAAAPPVNIARAFQRTFGPPGAGSEWMETYDRDHARAQKMNAEMAARGCPKLDLDARIAATKPQAPTQAAPPPPLMANGRGGGIFGR